MPPQDKTSLPDPKELATENSDAASVGDPTAPAGSPEIISTEKLKKKSRRARKEKKRQQRLLEEKEAEAEVDEPEPEAETEEVVDVLGRLDFLRDVNHLFSLHLRFWLFHLSLSLLLLKQPLLPLLLPPSPPPLLLRLLSWVDLRASGRRKGITN